MVCFYACRVSRKVGLLKRRVRSHVVRGEIKICTPLWQNTSVSERFLMFWCRKLARGCGEKHILKWKCTKHLMIGALLEVLMSKKCTRLRRKAHFEVKMYKAPHARSTFGNSDVEKLHAAVARSTFTSQNAKKLTVSDHFLKFRCPKIARCCGEKRTCNSKCTKYLCFGTLFKVQMSKNLVS